MHVVLVITEQFPPEIAPLVHSLHAQHHTTTLLYNPNLPLDFPFFALFSAAFPLLLPQEQLEALQPELILSCDSKPAFQTTRCPMFTVDPALPVPHELIQNKMTQPKQLALPRLSLPTISIIMRTKNSADILDQTLKALFSQQLVTFDFLAIDSGSTDQTVSILKAYEVKVHAIESKNYFPGPVLNHAMTLCKGQLVVFLNSDAVMLTPYTLYNLLRTFQDSAVQAAFARQIARPEAHTWVRRDYQTAFPDHPEAPKWLPLSLCLAAMRRSIWQKRAFYSFAWGSEDVEWGRWAQQSGHKIFYAYDSLVMHSHNYTLSQLYGRRFIEGEADAYIYKNNYGYGSFIKDWIKSTARDVYVHIKSLDLVGGCLAPMRRMVYYWAYYQGHKHGERRVKSNDVDASLGQETVLSRHDSFRK
jgi:rhamnosyltransferase